MKIKARRARNQPLPSPQPSRSYRNGSGYEVAQNHAPLAAGKKTRYSIDPCCVTLRCFEPHGKGAQRRQNNLIAYESPEEHIAERYSGHAPNLGVSEHPRSPRSMTRNMQSSVSSRTSSRSDPNYQATTTERSHAGSAWVKPGLSTQVRSPSNELSLRSNRSFSSKVSRRSARIANYSSKPPDMSPKLNPIFEAPSADEYHHSFDARDDRSVRRGFDANPSSIGSPRNGMSNRSVASPTTRSSKSGRSKQGSKAHGIDPNWNSTMSTEEHVCPGCAAKQGGSNELGTNSTRRSKGAAHTQNKQGLKSQGKQSTSKPKMTLSRLVGLGSTAKQGGLNPIESNVKHTCKPHGSQSRSHAIQQEAVGRRSLQESPTIRSSRNALSPKSPSSVASTKQSGRSHRSSSKSHRSTSESHRSTSESHRSTNESHRSSSKSQISTSKSQRSASKSHRSSSKSRRSSSKGRRSSSRSRRSHSRSPVSNSRRALEEGEAAETASPRDLGYVVGRKGRRRRLESATDSVSTLSLSLPSTSSAIARHSIVASEDRNPVYSGDRYGGSPDADGDGSSQESLAISREVGKVVDTIRSTARDVLLSDDVDNVWLSRDVLEEIAESRNVSVDALMETICDKLDNLDDDLLLLEEKKVEPAKPWFPRVHLSVNW